ncbi:MAG: hypothetical protein K6U09_12595 [Acidobacteriia bacterium]|nr:hypothetical protein [Terriglobia bacterium]
MAKFLSQLTSDIRGSIDGLTFSRNRFGRVIRAKVAPVNPSTTAQDRIRQLFGDLSHLWSTGIGDDNTTAWLTAASSTTLYDSLGQAYQPTGQNLFISVNLIRRLMGEPVTLVPQIGGSFPLLYTVSGSATAQDPPTVDSVTVTWTGAASAQQAYAVYAAAPVRHGVRFVSRPRYRWMGYTTGPIYTLAIGSQYVAKFGDISGFAGARKIPVMVVPLNAGRLMGPPLTAFLSIDTPPGGP